MQVGYGSYLFDANGVDVQVRAETVFSEAKIPLARRWTWIVHGYLTGSGQDALTLAQASLTTALAVPNQLLALYTDGGAIAMSLTPVGSITGVLITKGPEFPEGNRAEWVNQRTFSFEAEAEYPYTASLGQIVRFQETVSFGGGGPMYIMRRAINGPPQRQLVYPQIEYTASQHGTAVGYRDYPTPPGPLFPGSLKEPGKISLISPAKLGQGYQHFGVEWSYEFESVGPLVGAPNLWP